MKTRIEDRIKQLVADHFGIEKDEVTNQMSFTDDLSATAVEITDLFTMVEHDLEVKITSEEIKTLKTVGELIQFIEDNSDEF